MRHCMLELCEAAILLCRRIPTTWSSARRANSGTVRAVLENGRFVYCTITLDIKSKTACGDRTVTNPVCACEVRQK